MTHRLTLRLTLDITYDVGDADSRDLEDNLLGLATRGCREGLFTGSLDATVVVANPSVEILE
jgi:hypothetical protein